VRIPRISLFGKGVNIIYGWLAGIRAALVKQGLVYGRNITACAIASILGANVIFEAHALDFYRRWSDKLLFRIMIRKKNLLRIVFVSGQLKEDVVQLFPELEDRAFVAHDAADIAIESNSSFSNEYPGYKLHVGYVGHLYPGRGYELIRDLAIAAPWAAFHLVGGTEEVLSDIRQDATTPSNIILHGFVPPKMAEQYRLACDVLLAPYQSKVSTNSGIDTTKWMSPLKLFEYMAAGKPIICSDLPVLREILSDRDTALMVEPENPDKWLESISILESDQVLSRRLAENAKTLFLSKYTWQARAKAVISGYLNL
ncbi:MAG: glycosyltransferase family 4 protein, partial [Gammaproteobacteria bacterium]|nr:glycosyltransferase family 4 protein [Gammaproteobacteria bacterium]